MRPLRAAFCNPRAVYTPLYPPPRITTRGGLSASDGFFGVGLLGIENNNTSEMDISLHGSVDQPR